MDIRGHGLSEKPRSVYGDSKLWAEDVHAVITGLGLNRPVLSGWSYAGAIICDYVSTYGEEQIAGTNWVGAICRLGEPLLAAGFHSFVRMLVHEEPSPEDLYFFLGFMTIVPPHVREACSPAQRTTTRSSLGCASPCCLPGREGPDRPAEHGPAHC
jgi:non-heme chloroperoxidase